MLCRRFKRGDEYLLRGVKQRAVQYLRQKLDFGRGVGESEVFVGADVICSTSFNKPRPSSSEIADPKYMARRFVSPTSNICKSLLSTSGNALRDPHNDILPTNFQMQIFLHVILCLWACKMSTACYCGAYCTNLNNLDLIKLCTLYTMILLHYTGLSRLNKGFICQVPKNYYHNFFVEWKVSFHHFYGAHQ